ncbi:Crp/Fnr family transcriptional regulator [Pseudogemmobacter humi]|uniref:HTH crp-type domain-containing protein n=1 Tax=Pseudogemmobacter humi TaxID=2483812 RepID=A0A3P5XTN5_9RHOB|nr:Crp/Fnr family transcriptional regulator [Pseudogemmobacter humi]VDC33655.1 hypothetical protein XINFAN_03965 [Pseudogemmobacter humi]
MAASALNRQANRLLSRLSDEDWQRLARHLIAHEPGPGDMLQKAGDEVSQTWFPCGTASAGFQVWTDSDCTAVDVGTIGSEGAIGGIVSNGRVPAYASAEVRSPGLFLSIRISQLERAKTESLALRHWFARYSDCLVAQLFQNSACNASHTIRQRVARWLLASAESYGGDHVPMTQEQLARILGVGRTFITRVVGELRASGLIATRRGLFILSDPDGLRAAACGCSGFIARHYEAVMGGIYPHSPGGPHGR